ncbi:MAG: LysR family transcriptional regulator [Sphingomonas bacterium]
MDLKRLQYFAAVAEEGSLRRAAAKLNVTQPAVTYQLAALENELGLDLFIRSGVTITLTAAGASYLSDVRRILDEIDVAARSAQKIATGKLGRLRLGLCEEVTTSRLMSVIGITQEKMPEVGIDYREMSSIDQVGALRRNEIDLSISTMMFEDPDFEQEPLWTEGWNVVLPPGGHPLETREIVHCAELAGHNLVLYRNTGAYGDHGPIRELFMNAGIRPKVAALADTRSTLLMLTAAGVGITFVPSSLAVLGMKTNVMRPLEAPEMSVHACFHKNYPSGVALQFLRVVREVIGK